ncbi:hypothetical protein GW17_00055948 [Ensete ventricosum]|nr:hypothetical protein GW17_00055948 [Ensete ventricosum]
MDAKTLSALEVMKSCHDFDSIVTEGSLAVVRVCYSISEDYALHASLPRQRPYSPSLLGFSVSVDTLKAGLLFPLHPIIEECLKWWRISPSQVVSNLWHYLIAFLGECQRAGIISSRDLFMTCFHLCKSQSDYYLIARIGFRVSGTPSNNKGWKTRYLFVSGPKWGFRLEWSAHSINNVSPYLFEESILVGRLKRNLSSSQAIRDMTELWLVKTEDLKSRAGPEAIAAIEQRATKLLIMNEKLKADLDEASLWLDASNKELNDTLSLLTDAQR